MGKGKRNKAKHSKEDTGFRSHVSEVLTRNFQKEIRNSKLWPKIVAEFGEEEAERILLDCKGELRPKGSNDESGDRSTDL